VNIIHYLADLFKSKILTLQFGSDIHIKNVAFRLFSRKVTVIRQNGTNQSSFEEWFEQTFGKLANPGGE